MKTKDYVIITIISLIITILCFMSYINIKNNNLLVNEGYLVYLNGDQIGFIENNKELYELINKEQEEIRYEYDVADVYPPAGFNLVKVSTYNDKYNSVNEIYNKIAQEDNFTIEGYIITIKFNDENKENIVINVLDKEIFTEAMNRFILSFISEDELNNYLDGKRTISDIGSVISSMYFNEVITIKEGYISVHDKIYTDVESLSQYLLFGPDAKMETYKVEVGDNIEKISEEYKMSPQEFIIANPEYRDENALLTEGDLVNITYIDPVLTLVYEVDEIIENVTPFRRVEEADATKDYGYRKVTTPGVDGLALDYAVYQVINGERSSEVRVVQEYRKIIREKVDEVTTVGIKYSPSGYQISSGGNWEYPTNYPYYVTSPYGWRSGKMHLGLDISGTGYNSPIYAVDSGTVVEVSYRSTDGNFVIIEHANNIYTQYAHLAKALVKEGETVSKGQKIAQMGHSGLASGTHLHFGVSIGWPYHGSYEFKNPRNYIKF